MTDDRVHEADVHLLPGPGDIQDPVGNPNDVDDSGGRLLVVQISDQSMSGFGTGAGPMTARYRLYNNGQAETHYSGDLSGSPTVILSGQWLMAHPVEVADAALYESRATLLSGAITNGTLDAWENLGTTRTWENVSDTLGELVEGVILVEIREVSTGIVQDSARIALSSNFMVGSGD